METTFDQTALETIDLLEARLKRIEYAVCGHADEALLSTNKESATVRLQTLEHSLHQLASKSRVIQDLLRLHSRHPDLFQSIKADELPSTLDPETLLSIVLASASAYPAIAAQLTSIMDVPIPAAETSTQLIDLQPRIARLETIQASQSAEIAELRERSAVVLQRWYTQDILKVGDNWANLEGRIEQAEQRIRRVSLAKRVDDAII